MDKNNFLDLKKKFIFIGISLLLFLLITLIIYFPDSVPLPFFEKYLPYNIATGAHADWIAIIDAKRCLLQGYNVYMFNPCHSVGRVWVYGEITLLLPFVNELNFFYHYIVPNIINFYFCYFKDFKSKKFRRNLIYIYYINFPTLYSYFRKSKHRFNNFFIFYFNGL